MEKTPNQLKSGALLSYVNLALSSIIPIIYTPIMLRLLGRSEYGLYTLSASVISYLSLLSFGFGSTILRYIALYRAENKKEEEETTFGFFLALYSIIALLVLICGTIIAFHTKSLFYKALTTQELDKMHTLVLIMTFNSAISFPISVFSSVITAHERYIFRRLVDLLAAVAAPIASLVALYLGYASVGMAISSTLLQVLILPLNIRYCLKNLGLRPKFQKLPAPLVKEMLQFSVFVFIGTIVDMLFWSTDKVILGMLSSSAAVAVYNIGTTFNVMVMAMSTSISNVLTPRITGMVANGACENEFTELFIKIGRLQYIIIGLVVTGFAVFGQAFISIWAGTEYLSSFWIAILTMFPLSIPLIQNTGLNIIVAQNKHQFRAIVYLIIAIINVVSTYLVVPYLGGIGAALCTCISYLLGQGIIMNIYYHKVTGINVFLFWKNILKMSAIPVVLMSVGILLSHTFSISSWLALSACIAIYTVFYAVGMYFFSMNHYEKSICKNLASKLQGTLSHRKQV